MTRIRAAAAAILPLLLLVGCNKLFHALDPGPSVTHPWLTVCIPGRTQECTQRKCDYYVETGRTDCFNKPERPCPKAGCGPITAGQ